MTWQDYAKLTEEELAETESNTVANPTTPHTTFVPHSHPFAHARLLNVVCRVSNLDKTVKVRAWVRGEAAEGREGAMWVCRVHVCVISFEQHLHSTNLSPTPKHTTITTIP